MLRRPTPRADRRTRRSRRSLAVVRDRERDGVVASSSVSAARVACAVAHDIGQRFLRDAKQHGVDRIGQRRAQAGGAILRAADSKRRRAALFAQFARELVERGGEPEVVEHRGTQRMRDAAHFAQRAGEPPETGGERGFGGGLARFGCARSAQAPIRAAASRRPASG